MGQLLHAIEVILHVSTLNRYITNDESLIEGEIDSRIIRSNSI